MDPAEGRPERMMPLPGARPSEQAAGSERPSSQLWRAGALRAPVEEAEVAQYSLRPSPPGFPTAPGSLRRARGASGTGSGPSSTTVWLLTSPTFLHLPRAAAAYRAPNGDPGDTCSIFCLILSSPDSSFSLEERILKITWSFPPSSHSWLVK